MAWCCLVPSHYLNQCWPRYSWHVAPLEALEPLDVMVLNSNVFHFQARFCYWHLSWAFSKKLPSYVCPIDDKTMLVQVMAWCCQATSHLLKQYWPRSTGYGVIRLSWVDSSSFVEFYSHLYNLQPYFFLLENFTLILKLAEEFANTNLKSFHQF